MKDCRKAIPVGFGLLSFFVWIVYNIKNNVSFLDAPLYSILTLVIAAFLSYYMVQQQNKKRRKADTLLNIFVQLETEVLDESMYAFANESPISRAYTYMRNRRINNIITVLEQNTDNPGCRRCIVTIKERFFEYEDFLGNHIDDIVYLSNSSDDLRRPLDIIVNEINKVRFILADC